jgi:lysophospholipase L1-like esterase
VGASIVYYWPLPLHNAGIAGQTTAQVLERFKSDVLGHGYVRVVILCGTNDVLQHTPNLITEATDNLAAMAKIATNAGVEVVLSELPPAMSSGVDLNATISQLNASIAQLALQQGYLVVDYFTPMFGHPEFFLDGIHPNSAGYAVMAKALAAVVVD